MNYAIPPSAIVLSLKGYMAMLSDVKYDRNTEPLFSYHTDNLKHSIIWGSSAIRSTNRAFWVTELAVYTNGHFIHLLPGAFVKTRIGSHSREIINKAWLNIHQKYTFPPDEITKTQHDIRLFLEDICLPDSVIYHRGPFIEKSIGILLNAPSVFLGYRGIDSILDGDVIDQQEAGFCKVHTNALSQCPKAQVNYFMKNVSDWYYPEDMPTSVQVKKVNTVELDQFTPKSPSESSLSESYDLMEFV